MHTTPKNPRWTATIFVFGFPVSYPFICEQAARGFANIMSHFGYESEVSLSAA